MEIQELQKKVDNGEDLKDPLKQYLDENFDRLKYSVSFEAVTIEAPRNAERPIIEASFMSHQDSESEEKTISRNTIVRVYGSDFQEFREVELMVGESLWNVMKRLWAQAEPSNQSMKQDLRDALNLDEDQ